MIRRQVFTGPDSLLRPRLIGAGPERIVGWQPQLQETFRTQKHTPPTNIALGNLWLRADHPDVQPTLVIKGTWRLHHAMDNRVQCGSHAPRRKIFRQLVTERN